MYERISEIFIWVFKIIEYLNIFGTLPAFNIRLVKV